GAWTPGAGTVEWATTTNLLNNTNWDTFNHLTIDAGGAVSMTRAIVTNGNLTVNAGSTFSMNGFTLDVTGNLGVAGTFTVNQDLDVIGTTTLGGTMNVTGNAGAKRFRGDVSIAGGTWNVTVDEDF